ncbi:MAG: helix-turn-helix domain-containing protein [Paracoccus aminovorans]|nr:helix-turn-helix domain-containing protein [Paracoccus aminovorans]
MTRRKTIEIDRVLDATEAVIAEVGIHRLTLNLVAEKAGISRGGLAYSFRSKEDLIRATTAREMERFAGELARHQHPDAPGDPVAAVRARIAVSRSEDQMMIARAASLIASFLQSGEDTAPLRAQYRRDFDQLAGDDAAAARARIAFWAVEGLFLLRGLGFLNIEQEEWHRSLDEIRDMLPPPVARDAAQAD